ncbi:MAG: type II toxin-antitoxin system VapC family toxin [Prosthecobacter sp.]
MVVLDTNHFSELERGSAACGRLKARIEDAGLAAFLSVVTAEEVMAGWLARIRGNLSAKQRLEAYANFQSGLDALSQWTILNWTPEASDIFDDLRQRGIRIGTLDLRIASICLDYDATLLSRNLVDFRQVPGLKVENWLD